MINIHDQILACICSVDSSRKKAMKEPKMEDAIGFFKL
jgi:hypothetical protein